MVLIVVSFAILTVLEVARVRATAGDS